MPSLGRGIESVEAERHAEVEHAAGEQGGLRLVLPQGRVAQVGEQEQRGDRRAQRRENPVACGVIGHGGEYAAIAIE